jgi:hypothetical protein
MMVISRNLSYWVQEEQAEPSTLCAIQIAAKAKMRPSLLRSAKTVLKLWSPIDIFLYEYSGFQLNSCSENNVHQFGIIELSYDLI